jgi:hypothetical protein
MLRQEDGKSQENQHAHHSPKKEGYTEAEEKQGPLSTDVDCVCGFVPVSCLI